MEPARPAGDARSRRLLYELLRAQTVDEIINIAGRSPESESAEFSQLMSAVTKDATARRDWALVTALQQIGHVLTAMRNPLSTGHAPERRIIDLLWATPLARAFISLGDQRDWNGWAELLNSYPGLYGGECLSFLNRARKAVAEEDSWLTEHLLRFLADCHDGNPETAIRWWNNPVESGEGYELPYEFTVASNECVIRRPEYRDSGSTLGHLGQLLYRRQRGDRAENVERAIGMLRSAVDKAAGSGDIGERVRFQQSLANALNRSGKPEWGAEALDITAAALEGWAKDDDPELWGLIMNTRANSFAKLAEAGQDDLLQEAVNCYNAALTVHTRERDPRRWGIAIFGLAGAYFQRGEHGHPGDYNRAIRCLEAAGEVRTRQRDPYRWAMTQHLLGGCYLHRASPNRSSDLTRAIEYFNSALEVYRPELNLVEWCGSRIALGRAFLALFELDSRDDHLRQAEEALTDGLMIPLDKERSEVHRLLANCGVHATGRNISRWDEVLSHRYQALDLYSPQDQPRQWSEHAAAVGLALILRPNADRAQDVERGIRYLQDALEKLPDDANSELRARILAYLGAAHMRRTFGDKKENLERAERYCESALTLVTRERDDETWATAQTFLGQCLSVTDRNIFTKEQALARFERALACFEAASQAHDRERRPAVWADLQKTLGQSYLGSDRDGGRVDAIRCLQAASTVYKTLGAVTDVAEVQMLLAEAFLGQDDRRAALSAMLARRVLPVEVEPLLYGQASELLGNAQAARGKWEEAGLAYRDAVRARRRLSDVAILPTQRQQVRQAFRANLAEKAALALARAAGAADGDEQGQHLLRMAVEILDEGRAGDLAAALGRQANVFFDMKRYHPDLYRRYEASIARVNACLRTDRPHARITWRNPDASFDAQQWLADREIAQAAWAEFDALRARINYRTGTSMASEALTMNDIVGLLEPGKAIAYLLMDSEGHCLTLVISCDGTVDALWAPPLPDDFFWLSHWLLNQASFALVARFNPALDPVGKLRAALDATLPGAGRDLVAPLSGHLETGGVKSVYLIPCGLLSILPVHACPYAHPRGGHTTLADEFDVTHTPSIHFLRDTATVDGTEASRLTTVTNPLPNPQPLLFAEVQRDGISDAARTAGIQVVTLRGNAATKSAVLGGVSGAGYVDFACHGAIDHGDPLMSGLELAGDQRLTLGDLLDSRGLEGVRLATLAFCQSALITGDVFTDEPLSLASGFLEAGARAVLGTAWLVDDLATALLVGRLYRYHLVGDPATGGGPLPVATALRRAQKWLRRLTLADVAGFFAAGGEPQEQASAESFHESIRPFDHPIYWAPFVVLGS